MRYQSCSADLVSCPFILGECWDVQGLVESFLARLRERRIPSNCLLKQTLKEFPPVRTQPSQRPSLSASGSIFSHLVLGNASNPLPYRLDDRIRYDETVSPTLGTSTSQGSGSALQLRAPWHARTLPPGAIGFYPCRFRRTLRRMGTAVAQYELVLSRVAALR